MALLILGQIKVISTDATWRSVLLIICKGLQAFIACASSGLALHENNIPSTQLVCHGRGLRITRTLARCRDFGLTSQLGTLSGQHHGLAGCLCGFLYGSLSTDFSGTTCRAW